MIPESIGFAIILAWGLIAATLASKSNDWSALHNQDVWTCFIALMICAFLAPTLPMTALIVVIAMGIWVMTPSSSSVAIVGWRAAVYAMAYIIGLRYVEAWVLPWFFGIMVGMGVILACWSLFVQLVKVKKHWEFPFGYVVPEEMPWSPNCLQMNANQLHSLLSLCIASGCALLVTFWATVTDIELMVLIAATSICATPILLYSITLKTHQRMLSQGLGHIAIAGFATVTVINGWAIWIVAMPVIGLCLAFAWNDHGFAIRRIAWNTMFRFVWAQGWLQRFRGNGMASWSSLQGVIIPTGEAKGKAMPDAHNEWLHLFAEYGIIGVIAMTVLLVDAAIRLDGQPLLIVGLVFVSIATINSPFTLTRWRHDLSKGREARVIWFGSPSITTIALIAMIFIDGVYV